MCVWCVCCHPIYILDVRLVDAPAGVTQEGGHTGSLHLSFAVLVFIFIARRIEPSLSLVDREVEFFIYPRIYHSPLVGRDYIYRVYIYIHILLFVRKNPSSCDCTEIRTHVSTSEGFEVIN